MYEAFFGFSQRPFTAAPQAGRFFPAASIDAARQTLLRCIERSEGTGLLIGPAGTGKTLLLQVLAEAMAEKQSADKSSIVPLTGGGLETRRELLQAILFELKLPYQGMEEGELRLALVDHLTRGNDCPGGMLLLVDEAHSLGVVLLEELRMMTNLARDGEPRVRLVLAGSLELEELFASPQLETFSQRLAARCYLESFDRAETRDFIRFQVAVAGGQVERVFAPEALDTVYQATDGVPRLVNQLCDHALLLAHANGQRLLDAAAIEEAWADLQQLPTPWQGKHADSSAGAGDVDVVEFGSLADEDEDDGETASAERASSLDESADNHREHIVLDFRSAFADDDDPVELPTDPSATAELASPTGSSNGQPKGSDYHILREDEELQVVVDPYSGLKEPEEDEEDESQLEAGDEGPAEIEEPPAPPADSRVHGDGELETAAAACPAAVLDKPAQAAEAIVQNEPVADDGMEEEIVSDRYADLDDQQTQHEIESNCPAPPCAEGPGIGNNLEVQHETAAPAASEAVTAPPRRDETRIPLSEAMRRRIEAETAAAVARTLAEAEEGESPAAHPISDSPLSAPEAAAAERRGAITQATMVHGTMVLDPEELRSRAGVRQPPAGAGDDPELVRDEELARELSDILGASQLQPLGQAGAAATPAEHVAAAGDSRREDSPRDDIVIIDDDCEEYVQVPGDDPAHRVEKQDYKELFARLRRKT